jgi:hypothetical protein
MYTATVLLVIREFVPMTGVYGQSPSCLALISPPKDTSAEPEPTGEVFSGDGESITITVPKGYAGSVQLTYQLPNPRYVLLGLAFKGAKGGVGQLEFRSVSIQRDTFGSQLTVTDSCLNKFNDVNYDYVILVQEVATANIGLIDPDVQTEENEA